MKNIFRHRRCGAFLFVGLSIFTFTNPLLAQWVQTNGPYGGNIRCFAVSGTNLFAGIADSGVFRSTDNGANWIAVNTGLINTDVYALTVNDSGDIFAGIAQICDYYGCSGGGVFRSTDNGANWTPVNTGMTDPNVRALAINDSGHIFAGLAQVCYYYGCTEGGVFRSTDNGANWTAVNTGLTNVYVFALAINGSGHIFSGTAGGAFRSTDNGANWTAVNTGLTDPNVQALAIKDSGHIFAGTAGGVFLSTNNGTNWSAVNTGLTNTDVKALAVSDTNIFAGTFGGGVFHSLNNGASWTALNTGLMNPNVLAFAVSGTNLFAGTGGSGVFLSTNNGASWTAVNTGLIYTGVLAFAVSATNLFAGTSGGGVFLSTNNGASWTAVNTGLANTYVRALAVSGPNLFAGTDGGVFLSTNNGASWTEVNTGLTNTEVWAFAVSGTNLFAGTWNGGVFLSTNNGVSWIAVSTGLTNPYVDALAISGTNLFAGTFGGGVFHSTNNGASWTSVNTGLGDVYVRDFAVSGTNIFVGAYGGVFLLNNGASWTAVNTGLTNTDVLAFAVSGTNLFAGTRSGGVFLSTNDGTSWTTVNAGLTNTDVFALAVSGTNLFAGTIGAGVWRRPLSEIFMFVPPAAPQNLAVFDSTSTKIGIRWKQNADADFLRYRIYRGTSPTPTTKVDSTTGGVADTSKTFTGLTNGTRYYLRVTAVDSAGNESAYSNEVNGAPDAASAVEVLNDQIPKEYSLSQNYPNPFNPSTNIEFSVPTSSFVSLKVYDMLGRDVSTIVNEVLTAGVYKGTFYGTGLPSGVYFYRLRAGGFVETKKLILQK